MKNFFLGIIFFLFSSFSTYAQIVYIDINFILNSSEVGKSLNIYIKKIRDENNTSYKEIEGQFIRKEKELLAQQNILKKEEFDQKLKILSNEINIYKTEKKSSLNKLKKIQLDNTKKILEILNPIITNYVDKNSISLVVPKKNIIVGKKNLDITDEIVKLLNDKVKSLDF